MIESQDASKSISFKSILTSAKPTINLIKLFSFGLGIILISWLISQVEWAVALKILQDIPLSFLVLGLLLYTLSFYLRSVRFRLLLPPEQKLTLLFPIVLIHYTALNIIPARLGELSYVFLLKKLHHISTGGSVSSLIVGRVFDQIAISTLFLLSLSVVNVSTPWLQTVEIFVAVLLVISIVVLVFLLTYKEQYLSWLKQFLKRVRWDKHSITQRILSELEEIVIGFDRIASMKRTGKVFGISLLIWLSIQGVNYALLGAFHIQLSYSEIVFTQTFIILLTVLPFQVLNGMGIRQTAWTFIAVAMGVPKEVAIISAFGARIVSVLYLCLLGLYGLWKISAIRILRARSRARSKDKE